uniref:Triacylglycerol lipase 2 n=1 Tax=Vitis vinifera TaxID=29760 RepID=F6HIF6_VITVI
MGLISIRIWVGLARWKMAFWDWSWDELVSYDLPASFQYVHDQTGQKLHYVGHSLVIFHNDLHCVVSAGQNCCLNSSSVDVFLEHEPQSTATKNTIHLSQMIREGTLAMYDYKDEDENMEHYGQPTPPVYNMTTIPNDLPLFLSHGGQDALSDVNDVQLLLESLKDHDGDKLVVQYREDYAHADYVMASNAKQAVYDPLMAFFKLQ